MNVWAFDLATKVGVAMGEPPSDLGDLVSFSVMLRRNKFDDMYDLSRHFRSYLETRFAEATNLGCMPQMLVWEHIPHASSYRGQTNAVARDIPLLLSGRLSDAAHDHNLRHEEVYPQTIRKAFLGKPNAGERGATKQEVIARCKEWGFVPDDCKDDNRCDAVALWSYAQRHWCGWQPSFELIMGRRVPLVQRAVA